MRDWDLGIWTIVILLVALVLTVIFGGWRVYVKHEVRHEVIVPCIVENYGVPDAEEYCWALYEIGGL